MLPLRHLTVCIWMPQLVVTLFTGNIQIEYADVKKNRSSEIIQLQNNTVHTHTGLYLASRMPSYSASCLMKPGFGRVMLLFCLTKL